jgi:hypothetical protein
VAEDANFGFPVQTILDVEDSLFRVLSLDVWERCFYYYLLRHTHAAGRSSGMFALATIAEATGTSDTKVREAVRSMHAKGCIRIEERNKKGHLITVFLPAQIESLRSSEVSSSHQTLSKSISSSSGNTLGPFFIAKTMLASIACATWINILSHSTTSSRLKMGEIIGIATSWQRAMSATASSRRLLRRAFFVVCIAAECFHRSN